MVAIRNCPRAILFLSGALIVAFALAASASSLRAENWPSRPIKIIVPFAAGGAVDIVARLLQDEIGKALGTTVVVENRGGGAGVPASEALVRAAPDGYTIALMASNYVSNAIMQPNLSYDTLKDITPITMVVINTVLVLVPKDSSIRTLADLVAQAKAQPGKLSYATPGVATAMHFAGELLKSQAGINLVHVPYRGAGPALNDLLGNQVPIAIMGIGPAIPFVETGKLRAIAITTEKRSKRLPDVPTVAEAGFPGYRFGEWFAMIAPKGLPPEIGARLHAAIVKAVFTDAIKERLEKIGLEPAQSTPEELGKFLASETDRIRVIANEAKMLEQKQ
jgi:tripartite-type tricarboxylate transporter receptor subunit TctC